MIEYSLVTEIEPQQAGEFFNQVFTQSADADEGLLVGKVATELATALDNETVTCFKATEHQAIVGMIFLSRLRYQEQLLVYLLSPVAIASNQQGRGIGQALINFAIHHLSEVSTDLIMTYGDPAFYCKMAFRPVSESTIPAPFPLSMPVGWLARPVNADELPLIKSTPTCVAAFDNPSLW